MSGVDLGSIEPVDRHELVADKAHSTSGLKEKLGPIMGPTDETWLHKPDTPGEAVALHRDNEWLQTERAPSEIESAHSIDPKRKEKVLETPIDLPEKAYSDAGGLKHKMTPVLGPKDERWQSELKSATSQPSIPPPTIHILKY
jgi:hypothetical protein